MIFCDGHIRKEDASYQSVYVYRIGLGLFLSVLVIPLTPVPEITVRSHLSLRNWKFNFPVIRDFLQLED